VQVRRSVRASPGNQQKVCIARAMTLGSSFVGATRGIDVGAKERVLRFWRH
jgi:ABC-type sugar transport system ATPase subunit